MLPICLFYRRGDQVLTVPVDTAPPLVVGSPEVLFEGPYEGSVGYGAPNYEIAVDGSRFLMSHDVDHASVASTQLDVVLNWLNELQRLVPSP